MVAATAAALLLAPGAYWLVARWMPAEQVTFLCTHGWKCRYSHAWDKPYGGFTLLARTEARGSIWAMSHGTTPPTGKPRVVEIDITLRTGGNNEDTVTVRGPSLEALRRGEPLQSVFDAAFVRTWLSQRGAGSTQPDAESEAIASQVAAALQRDLQPARVGAFEGFGWLEKVPFQSAYQRLPTNREWYAAIIGVLLLFVIYLVIWRDAARDRRSTVAPAVPASG